MIRIVAVSVAALWVAGPAAAGWRTTGWGMTPLEVAVALHPAAAAISGGEPLPGTRLTLRNEGSFASGPFALRGQFYYDAGHLMLVRLTLDGARDCGAYHDGLIAELGTPGADRSTDTADIMWRDERAGNLVRYRQYDARVCYVDYTPLPPP